MDFLHRDLGHRKAGEVVEVQLRGRAANVRLMDSSNLSNYRNRRRYRYLGAHVTRSPYRMRIPRSGHWHIVVD